MRADIFSISKTFKSFNYYMGSQIIPVQLDQYHVTGMILGLQLANKRWRYFVITSFIGWAQA